MIDRFSLPIGAPSGVLTEACNARINILLGLHRQIDEHKLTTACQVQNMIQDMISELEQIKEIGE